MQKIKPSVLLALFCCCLGSVTSQTRFQNLVGGTGIGTKGYGNIIKTADGGYATTGSYFQNFLDKHDVYITKFDNNGNLQWAKTAGDTTSQTGFAITQTSDGGYAIAGSSQTVGTFMGYDNGYVVKVSSTGVLQWARNIGGYEIDQFRSIVQTPDGGLVVAGYSSTFCFGLGINDVYVVKLDISGTVLWTKNIGGAGFDIGMGLVQTADNGFVIAGSTLSYGQGAGDFYCVKLNSIGNLVWTKSIGGAQFDWGYAITKTNDGGFAIAGITNSFGAGADDCYIVKLDGNGNLVWTRSVGGSGNDRAVTIAEEASGNLIIAGSTDSYGAGGEDMYVIKLNSYGLLLWTRTIGGTGGEQAWGVLADTDGGYVVSGFSNSFNGWSGALYLVKMDSNGNTCANQGTGGTVSSGGATSSGGVTGSGGVSVGGGVAGAGGAEFNMCFTTGIEESMELSTTIQLAPNPASGHFTIYFGTTVRQATVTIFNSIGEKVMENPVSNESSKIIDAENLLPGIYLLEIIIAGERTVKKLVKE